MIKNLSSADPGLRILNGFFYGAHWAKKNLIRATKIAGRHPRPLLEYPREATAHLKKAAALAPGNTTIPGQ